MQYRGSRIPPWITKVELECLLEFLKIREGDLILDIGVGTGRLAYEVAKLGATVTGLELDLDELVSATRLVLTEKFHPILCDLNSGIPLEQDSLDMAYCVRVIKYLGSPLRIIKEISRVLRTGGTLVLEISNWYSWEHAYCKVRGAPPFRFFRKREITEMLTEAGFKIESSRPLHKVPSRIYALDGIIRKLTPEQFLSRGIMIKAIKLNPTDSKSA